MTIRPAVAVLNRSTVMSDDEVEAVVQAMQHQLDHDFTPIWGVGAILHFQGAQDMSSKWSGKWNIVVLDTSDEANALGYHDLTPEGLPLGKAFAKTSQKDGELASVTIDHELLEMLADPYINLTASDKYDRIFAYENCDPVEAASYEVQGVTLSDFVYPQWFTEIVDTNQDAAQDALGRVRYDHLDKVTEPFTLDVNGYCSYTDNWPPRWRQAFGDRAPVEVSGDHPAALPGPQAIARPKVGSRRERRATPRLDWQRSAA
jgi:hypothetical protein